jgi:hypothetical protein
MQKQQHWRLAMAVFLLAETAGFQQLANRSALDPVGMTGDILTHAS